MSETPDLPPVYCTLCHEQSDESHWCPTCGGIICEKCDGSLWTPTEKHEPEMHRFLEEPRE